MSLYHCPADKSTVTDEPGVPRTRSYSLSTRLAGDADQVPPVLLRLSDIVNPGPSQALAFLDEHENTIDDGHFFLFPAPDNRWANMPSDRHNQGVNLTFADGHAEHWKWKWPKQVSGNIWKPADNDADLQDLRRIQAAMYPQ